MKNKLPTAEEFLRNEWGNLPLEQINSEGPHVVFCMQEFAKLHVKAALKAAYECDYSISEDMQDSYAKTDINGDSILNAYPENLIK